MKPLVVFTVFAGLLMAGVAGVPAMCQQGAVNTETLACGAAKTDFEVKKGAAPAVEPPIQAGKARVYIVESLPNPPFVTKNVNIGIDGAWLGATIAQTHMSFYVTPGVHHLCAVYQGSAAGMDVEGRILLLRLNVEAGKTYYVSYHGMFLKESPSIAFLNFVDEDEGSFLVQRTQLVTSTAKQ